MCSRSGRRCTRCSRAPRPSGRTRTRSPCCTGSRAAATRRPTHAGPLAPLLREMLSPHPKRGPRWRRSPRPCPTCRPASGRAAVPAAERCRRRPLRVEDVAPPSRARPPPAPGCRGGCRDAEPSAADPPTPRDDPSPRATSPDRADPRRRPTPPPTAETIRVDQPTRFEPPTAETEPLGRAAAPRARRRRDVRGCVPPPRSAPSAERSEPPRSPRGRRSSASWFSSAPSSSARSMLFDPLRPNAGERGGPTAEPDARGSDLRRPTVARRGGRRTASAARRAEPDAPPRGGGSRAAAADRRSSGWSTTVTGLLRDAPRRPRQRVAPDDRRLQENHAGGRGGYEAFWSAIADVEIADVTAIRTRSGAGHAHLLTTATGGSCAR